MHTFNLSEQSVDADFSSDACDELGDIYLAWQDFPRAEKAYRRALTGNAFDSHAHFGLGKVLESTSRPGDALVEYENGLAMDLSDAAAGNPCPTACSQALLLKQGLTEPIRQRRTESRPSLPLLVALG